MLSAYDNFLSRLTGVRHVPGGGGTARRARALCPHHQAEATPGRAPSLSIGETAAGAVLIHCHAGCTVEEIAGAVGLQLTDLFPKRSEAPAAGGVGASWLPVAAIADQAYMLCMALAARSEVHADAACEFARLGEAFRREARAAVRRASK